jgi:serine protease Do
LITPFSLVEDQITNAVEKLSESVVNIDSTTFARTFRYGVVPLAGSGSGLILDSSGHIITNNHVIENGDRVEVTFKDGAVVTGNVIGSDPATDVAVVKVRTDHELVPASLGDSEKLRVGQMALAIGNSLDLPGGPTVSAGVVSALGRPLPGADFIYEGFIQTDAAVNPGNSGGPLADLNGNVIGINTAIIPFAQGVGFAIPINIVKNSVTQILEKGRVVRPWIGITGVDVNDSLSRRYELGTNKGVLVVGVSNQSPADEAGLRQGDVITGIDKYDVVRMKDLLSNLSRLDVGEIVNLTIHRRGLQRRISLRLIEIPQRILRRLRE